MKILNLKNLKNLEELGIVLKGNFGIRALRNPNGSIAYGLKKTILSSIIGIKKDYKMVGKMKTKGMRKMAKGAAKMMKARGGRMMPDRPIASGAMRKGTMARPMGAMKGKMAK